MFASARAIPTRCFCPPLSWEGYAFSRPLSPTSVISSATRALMDALEIDVPGALEKCIRVMLLIDTENKIDKKHIYLRGAKRLRPDLDGDE